MPYWLSAIIVGTIVGVGGTSLGAAAGLAFKSFSAKRVGECLGFTAGIMLALVLVELLPYAFFEGDAVSSALALAMGIIAVALFERVQEHQTSAGSDMRRIGGLIAAVTALHNFPEGMAIGAGLRAGNSYTLVIVLALWLHDIPEGMSMAVPLRAGGTSALSALMYTALAGVPTGLGAYVGAILGESPALIAACMAFAGGAMLAISIREMLPKLRETAASPWTVVLGALLGAGLAIFL